MGGEVAPTQVEVSRYIYIIYNIYTGAAAVPARPAGGAPAMAPPRRGAARRGRAAAVGGARRGGGAGGGAARPPLRPPPRLRPRVRGAGPLAAAVLPQHPRLAGGDAVRAVLAPVRRGLHRLLLRVGAVPPAAAGPGARGRGRHQPLPEADHAPAHGLPRRRLSALHGQAGRKV